MRSALPCNPSHYCASIAVLDRDIDHMGHVNKAVYIQWAQMVTQNFWESRATPQMMEETLWVALRHEIDYRRPFDKLRVSGSGLGSTLFCITGSGADDLLFLRD
jgi:hypothetical protein